ncbi:DUF4007 family protein [Asticcacaulis sp.]|uniref:DUF4007 family protein n=1 Tax=Asticcacaulis sp. TaxID=1872648 RepID=UPI00261D95BF|nr:DUF4007 family protein [Asticcacaulis sp.]
MVNSLLIDPRFKLQFAGHETFPLRYGWLKKSYDAVCLARLSGNTDTRTIFTDDSAIAYFGVGKNMVASMRYWAHAANILSQGDDDAGLLEPTDLGRMIFEKGGDPFLDDPASLWLIHWHLASTPNRTTTWYWAFNELYEPTFTRELLLHRLLRRLGELREVGRLNESRLTEMTLKRDIECFVRTYAARQENSKVGQEDNLESPLSELGLLQCVEGVPGFQFRRGPKMSLPDEIFLYGLVRFWTELYPTRREFTVEAVTHEPGSPGRVFLLDEESVVDRLVRLADLTDGVLRWDESTGMRQVYAAKNLEQLDPMEYLARLYDRTAQRDAA